MAIAASARVFAVPELVELIIQQLDVEDTSLPPSNTADGLQRVEAARQTVKDFFRLRRVNTMFNSIMSRNPHAQVLMFLKRDQTEIPDGSHFLQFDQWMVNPLAVPNLQGCYFSDFLSIEAAETRPNNRPKIVLELKIYIVTRSSIRVEELRKRIDRFKSESDRGALEKASESWRAMRLSNGKSNVHLRLGIASQARSVIQYRAPSEHPNTVTLGELVDNIEHQITENIEWKEATTPQENYVGRAPVWVKSPMMYFQRW